MDASNREKLDRVWPKHSHGETCDGCDARMLEAHPKVWEIWKELKQEFPSAHVAWVWRNKLQQFSEFKKGASKLEFPHSQHNKTLQEKPCSRAFDVFSLNPKGVAVWDPGYMRTIWKWIQSRQFPMRWGGAWQTLGDFNHFEIERWVEPRADGETI